MSPKPSIDRLSLTRIFGKKAEAPIAPESAHPLKKKKPSPISLRLSDDERARLERDAAGMSLSAYIRGRLFTDSVTPRKTRGKFPVKDHQALAKVLSALGRTNLARDLGKLEWAVDNGVMTMSAHGERELRQACANIAAMRADLVTALGLQAR